MKQIILFCLLFLLQGQATYAAEAETARLSLDQAVRLALRNNLGLQLSREEQAMAKGAALAQYGNFDPLLEAGISNRDTELTPTYPPEFGGISEDKEAQWQASIKKRLESGTELGLSWLNQRNSTNLAISTLEPVYSSTLAISVNQPLLQGFGRAAQLAQRRAAEKELAAATYQVESQAANLASEVKTAYWQLVFARQDIEVKQLSLKLAEQLRDETAERIRVGSMAQVEIYQPESEVARRQQQLIGARRAIGLAEDNLKLLMNSRNWQQTILPVDRPPTSAPQPDQDDVLRLALRQRPDLQAAEQQVAAARFQHEAAHDRLASRLDLSGMVGLSGVDDDYGQAMGNLVDNSNHNWQVGLRFSRPLGNSLAEGQAQQARANLRHSRTRAALLRQQIKQQVRQAVRDVELANKAVEAATKTAIATRKRLEAQQAKFEVGLATTYDVLAAQEAYSQALSAENLSKVQLAAAISELDRIQGRITLPQPEVQQ